MVDWAMIAAHEGGQRVISRFGVRPRDDSEWFCTVARHWNLEGRTPGPCDAIIGPASEPRNIGWGWLR